jgi:hypothetical protein
MARKRLTKGTNALRVEERIAKVPIDLVRRPETGSGVFEALKKLEDRTEASGTDTRPETKKQDELTPQKKNVASKPKAGETGEKRASNTQKERKPEEKSERRLGPDSFTKAERRAIVRSCTDYRNRLPIYLRSAMHDVEILDSIIRKCNRFERETESDT